MSLGEKYEKGGQCETKRNKHETTKGKEKMKVERVK
jgi:hypothetical protein